MEISLTDREADVMRVLWEYGPSVVSEVKNHLDDDLAYTTVLTILRTLESKGYAHHQEEGRTHRYFAAVQKQVAQKSALRHLTNKLFGGSTELLFTHLVAEQKLSPKQLERLRKVLATKQKENDHG